MVHQSVSRSATRARPGQSMVELALLLPMIALLLVGTLDLGRVYFSYVRLSNAVKEGALFGAYQPTFSGPIRDQAYAEVAGRLGVSGTDFVVDPNAGDVQCFQGLTTQAKACTRVTAGDSIQVTGHYAFKPITTSIVGILGNTFWIRKSARMSIVAGFTCNASDDGEDDDDDGNGNGDGSGSYNFNFNYGDDQSENNLCGEQGD